MLKKVAILIVAAALGGGSAVGLAACGEDREGEVEFEGTETGGTDTTGTETETGGTETVAPTETESDGGAEAP